MNREEARKYLIGKMEEYLLQRGLSDACVHHNWHFRCLSPDHEDKHPSMSFNRSANKVHCFGCGVTYDIFDLIGLDYGLKDYNSQFQKACELFNVTVDNKPAKNSRSPEHGKNPDNSQKLFSFTGNPATSHSDAKELEGSSKVKDYSEYIEKSKLNRDQAKAYLVKRKISPDLADKFGLGVAKYFDKTLNKSMDMLVIPNPAEKFAVLRNLDDSCDSGDRYRKLGRSGIWNADAFRKGKRLGMTVLIVEGELDALSVLTCGGLAVALGSTENYQQVVPVLNDMFGDPNSVPFLLLALDNDEAGRKCAKDLSDALAAAHYPHKVVDLFCGCNDANEALNRCPNMFAETISSCRTVEGLAQWEYRQQRSGLAYRQGFVDAVEKDKYRPVLRTGYDLLDEAFEGGLASGLTFIGAIPSLGKTSFVLQMADHLASQGNDVLYFTLEMSVNELFARSISRFTYLTCRDRELSEPEILRLAKTTSGILLGRKYSNYSPEEMALIQSCMNRHSQLLQHFFPFEGVASYTVNDIYKVVADFIAKMGTRPVVIIDYLQILAPMSDRMTDKQATDMDVKMLKQISRQFDIPVIAISSFNRKSYGNASFEAFKESGLIEYSADVMLALQFKSLKYPEADTMDVDEEKARNPRNVELVVLKNRLFPTGQKIFYQYDARFNYYKECCYSTPQDLARCGYLEDYSSEPKNQDKPKSGSNSCLDAMLNMCH